LLSRLQLPFQALSPNIDETPLQGETPQSTATRLARQKAEHVAKANPNAVVIGSDQVATLHNLQIGKPGNHDNALKQLQLMRGQTVIFHTALCVASHQNGEMLAQVENVPTAVTFRRLTDAELNAYLLIERPYDCAGSAKNEGLGIALIERIESSDPTALTGLPLISLSSMLRHLGVHFFGV
jgi:septum formation protein